MKASGLQADRLAELRKELWKEQAEVVMLFHLTSPRWAADRDALMERYAELEEALEALSVELGEA